MEKTLSPGVRSALLALARASMEAKLAGRELPRKGRDYAEVAPEPRGAFVTLSDREGDLRGCIGHILPRLPLDETVVQMAVAAALEDPRFSPVTAEELPSLRIEISALTVPRHSTAEAVEVGRHGLIATRGWAKGLLLPQVATEYGWGREEFLRHTCTKAGLPADAWRDPRTKIETFEAEVWGE